MSNFRRNIYSGSPPRPSRSSSQHQLIDLTNARVRPYINVRPDVEVIDLFINPVRRNRSSIPPEIVVIGDGDDYMPVETPDHEVEGSEDEDEDEDADVSQVEAPEGHDGVIEGQNHRSPSGTLDYAPPPESTRACQVGLNELQLRSEIEAKFEARIKELEEGNRKLRSDKDVVLMILDSTDVLLQEYIELLEMLENKVEMMNQVSFRARALDWKYREEMEEAFEARVKALEEDNTNVKTRKDELEQLLDSSVDLQESRGRVISLEKEIEKMEEELIQAKGDLEDSEMGLEIAAEDKAELERKLLDSERLQSDFKKMQNENNKLKRENSTLRKNLEINGARAKGPKNSRSPKESTCVKRRSEMLLKSKKRGHFNHGLEYRTIVKLHRCYCGERFTTTWRCNKKECGDVFYTEEHLKAHTCKFVVGIADLGHPKTWKSSRCSIPYIEFDEKRMDDKTYVKLRINDVLGGSWKWDVLQ